MQENSNSKPKILKDPPKANSTQNKQLLEHKRPEVIISKSLVSKTFALDKQKRKSKLNRNNNYINIMLRIV